MKPVTFLLSLWLLLPVPTWAASIIASKHNLSVSSTGTVKALTPQHVRDIGAQIILGNTYHLNLRPGSELIRELGGLHKFMGWDGPILTDSGGFQVFSLDPKVDDDGVTFASTYDGSKHRFTPEVSMQVQHQLGADIMFAFDECTTLLNTRGYQERSLDRTYGWAERCIVEHNRLTEERSHRRSRRSSRRSPRSSPPTRPRCRATRRAASRTAR